MNDLDVGDLHRWLFTQEPPDWADHWDHADTIADPVQPARDAAIQAAIERHMPPDDDPQAAGVADATARRLHSAQAVSSWPAPCPASVAPPLDSHCTSASINVLLLLDTGVHAIGYHDRGEWYDWACRHAGAQRVVCWWPLPD